MKSQTIKEFESLRGYMALWVVVYHCFSFFYDYLSVVPFINYICSGGEAVIVFMIISGFVTYYILDQKHEKYFVFLIRRGLRLFPIYLFGLLISILMLTFVIDLLSNLHFKSGSAESVLRVFQASKEYFWPHVLSHLVLLQGIIPGSILPSSPYALLTQAWSLTLEWQFYILAPFPFYCFSKNKLWVKGVCGLVLLGLYAKFHNSSEAFIFRQIPFFALGGFSYYCWKEIVKNECKSSPRALIFLLMMTISSLILMVMLKTVAPLIWCLVFWVAKYNYFGNDFLVFKIINVFLLNRLSLFMGKISYSIYIIHMIIVYSLLGLIERIDVNTFDMTESIWSIFLFTFIVIITTTFVSWLTYKYIERPCIQFGKAQFNNRQDLATAPANG